MCDVRAVSVNALYKISIARMWRMLEWCVVSMSTLFCFCVSSTIHSTAISWLLLNYSLAATQQIEIKMNCKWKLSRGRFISERNDIFVRIVVNRLSARHTQHRLPHNENTISLHFILYRSPLDAFIASNFIWNCRLVSNVVAKWSEYTSSSLLILDASCLDEYIWKQISFRRRITSRITFFTTKLILLCSLSRETNGKCYHHASTGKRARLQVPSYCFRSLRNVFATAVR